MIRPIIALILIISIINFKIIRFIIKKSIARGN